MTTLWTDERSRTATAWAKPAFDTPRSGRIDDAAAAQARATAAEAAGEARGYAAGHAAGLANGQITMALIAEQLRGVLAALARPMAAVDGEMERVLIALTLEAARRIAQQELNLDPAKVAAVVRDAVASLGVGPRNVAVYVNPDDYAALTEAMADEMRSAEGWRLVADPEVLPGGCRVESEQASVVASLDARAAGLAHTLLMQP